MSEPTLPFEASEDAGTKRCKTCGQIKPFTEFYRDNQNADGHRAHCRDCWIEAGRVRRQENIDQALERERRYREDNREAVRERGRLWARANMAQQIEYQRQRTVELKTRVLAHYGRSCACCGCNDFDQLTVDHVDGNGGEHRIELFGSQKAAGRVFYLWLIRNDFPAGYQILCNLCNNSKGKTGHCRRHPGLQGDDELAG